MVSKVPTDTDETLAFLLSSVIIPKYAAEVLFHVQQESSVLSTEVAA